MALLLNKEEERKINNMEKKKKVIRNLIFFILLIAIVFSIVFKNLNIDDILDALSNVKMQFILVAVIAMCIYFTCEAINIRRALKAINKNVGLLKCIKYTLIGFFFSAITPAASGGQPMEIYFMYKEGIDVSQSTLALLVQLCSFQIVTISFGLISVFINHALIDGPMIGFFVLGITLNSMALALLLIGIFSKRLSKGLIRIAVKILKFFKIRNAEEKQEKLENEVKSYQESAVYIKQNRSIMIKTILTTIVQIIAFYSVTYWVYCSFGLTKFSPFHVITMQAVLYATTSGIPLPGAVGVSEGGFLSIFKSIFPEHLVGSAMLISRGVSFYLFVLISVTVVIINMLRQKDKKVDSTKLEK